MKIRLAKTEDSSILSDLIMASSETVRDSDFSEEGWKMLEETNTTEAFETRFSSDSYFAFLCEIDGNPAGYMSIVDFEKIDHMFVLPRYRGLGICRLLWNQAMAVCEQSGRGSYYWVRSSTAAEPVYEAFGFQSSGERDNTSGISSRLMELKNHA